MHLVDRLERDRHYLHETSSSLTLSNKVHLDYLCWLDRTLVNYITLLLSVYCCPATLGSSLSVLEASRLASRIASRQILRHRGQGVELKQEKFSRLD